MPKLHFEYSICDFLALAAPLLRLRQTREKKMSRLPGQKQSPARKAVASRMLEWAREVPDVQIYDLQNEGENKLRDLDIWSKSRHMNHELQLNTNYNVVVWTCVEQVIKILLLNFDTSPSYWEIMKGPLYTKWTCNWKKFPKTNSNTVDFCPLFISLWTHVMLD